MTENGAQPKLLDHVALWVADRDPLAEFVCRHLGMHEISRTDAFTLVGVDALRGKLTLFAAEGPRDPGALERVVLRVGDLEQALAGLPGELAVERPEPGVAWFDAPEGMRMGLVERPGTDVDFDLDHVVLRVGDPSAAAAAFGEMGFEPDGTRAAVADKHVELVGGGGGPEPERPLLNHLAVLVDSAAAVEREAERSSIEVADVVDAENTIAVFLWGPDRIKVEYVEHKPTFSLR
jgi:catechol 2,3-dioxygenase-like lactoylglutathione lyase family enzyme